jgi:hypothetical protein
MNYELNKLNSKDFESLCQSLSIEIFGNGVVSFGDGPDGGREATFEGEANYPSEIERWTGYWVIQAKFKTVRTSEEAKDFDWLKTEIYKELKKYDTRKTKVKKPHNIIFFTNIILTPFPATGGRDKAIDLIEKLKIEYSLKNISIISYDDIVTLLNNHRNIATAFSSFILPGDILFKLYTLLNKEDQEKKLITEYLGRYLEVEFKNNISSKLEHAGKLTEDKINLEKVFIDLYATSDGNLADKHSSKFAESIINLGNSRLNPSLKRNSRYVLIAGPGYGKSTLTQFLSQIYTAYFLINIDNAKTTLKEIDNFLDECASSFKISPKCIRFPFRIVLKEYASWIFDQSKKKLDYSLVNYLKTLLNKKCGVNYFSIEIIEELLKSLSLLIIFDGLDEVPSSSNRQEVIGEINKFTEIVLRRFDSDALFIGTSRPQGYSKEFDSSSYTHLKITDLSREDCLDYINKLLKSIEENSDKRRTDLEILKAGSLDPVVSRLMKSPLQASIMTILVRSGGEPPRNKYELFTDYYSIIFRREKQKGVSKILNDHPSYIDAIHYKLGYILQCRSESTDSPSATISLSSFKDFIEDYLHNDVGLTAKEMTEASKLIIDASTLRLIFIEEIQDGQIGFNIRSLQEFFAANYLMQNRRDSEIQLILKRIASSSYWSNTLMFTIGYLFKHKNYTIDHVESVCGELNGSGDFVNSKSLYSIYNSGSWLSLDILNEAIFRGHPKYENKFCKNLNTLFYLPYIDKHDELPKLPDGIKKEYIYHYLRQGIQSNNKISVLTCWGIVFNLLKIKPHAVELEEIMTLWPNSNSESKALLNSLPDLSFIETSFGKELFIKAIINSEPLELYELIDSLDYEQLLEIVKSNNDKKLHNEIFSALSLMFFYFDFQASSTGSINDLLLFFLKPVLPLEDIKRFSDYFIDKSNRIEFSIISDWYFGEIKPVFKVHSNDLKSVQSLSEYYEVDYLKKLINFYTRPSTETLTQFYSYLGELNTHTLLDLSDYFDYLNWLFKKIGELNLTIEEKIELINKEYWGTETDWIKTEASFEKQLQEKNILFLLRYISTRSPRVSRTDKKLDDVFDFLQQKFTNPSAIVEFFRVLEIWGDENFEYIRSKFEHDESLSNNILTLFEELYFNTLPQYNKEAYASHLIILLTLIPKSQILNKIDRIEKYCSQLVIKSSYYNSSSLALNQYLFDKVIDLIPAIDVMIEDCSIIRIIPTIILRRGSLPSIVETDIPFSMVNKDRNLENQFSYCVLFILAVKQNKKHLPLLEEIISRSELTEDMLSNLITMIQKFKITSSLDDILLSIHKKIDAESHIKASYLELIKTYVESQPSNIDQIVPTS